MNNLYLNLPILESAKALDITVKLIAVAVFLQSVEFLQIRKVFSDHGVWRWATLKKDFAAFWWPLPQILEIIFCDSHFRNLLVLRAFGAVLIFFWPQAWLALFLLMTTVLISMRWRGTFNGGSDYMTVIVLSAITLGALWAVKLALWYIAAQSCLSYFIGGAVKMKASNWRSGEALTEFICHSRYQVPTTLQNFLKVRWIALLCTWLILIFECSFPLALTGRPQALAYITLALLFHLGNFYAFGLNRFLFAWLATYPALYFCS